MPSLVPIDQVGFIKVRTLLDNVFSVQAGFHAALNSSSHYLGLALDNSKAFDRVGWPYLLALIYKLGIGPRLGKLIQTLITQISAKLCINGMTTNSLELHRSLRQGCPLSPILFALATVPIIN